MPAILRHPRFSDPIPGYLAEADALDRAELCEQYAIWQARAQRRREAIAAAKWLLAAACLGATVAALWLVKAWG